MSVRQPAMVRFDDDIKHNMMVNIARLYYLKRMTHQQIGQKLGLSRVKVTRLLKEVVEKRIVEFRIQDPIVNTLELQDELEQRLGLSQAVVVPSAGSEAETYENLGAYAADFLMKSMEDNLTIGIERLRRIPKIFGVTGGRQKVRSVLGAIRTGLFDVLITDEYCARKVLKIAEGKKTK